MKTRNAFTIFHFWYQKMIFPSNFLMVHVLDQEVGPKGLQEKQTKIVCCFWLLQTTYMEEMKAGSTSPPVQLTPLSPTRLSLSSHSKSNCNEAIFCSSSCGITVWDRMLYQPFK